MFKILLFGLIAFLSSSTNAADDVPYTVQFRGLDGETFCSGTVITPKYILTSALCVFDLTPAKLFVIGGLNTRSEKDTEKYAVEKIVLHPEFSTIPREFDVAVVKLVKELPADKFRPVELCSKSLKKGDEICTTAWEYDNDKLFHETYTVIPQAECAQQYGKVEEVTVSMFCAGTYHSVVGGLGRPAIHGGQLCGVFSTGETGYPHIFADVHLVKSFIEEAIKA